MVCGDVASSRCQHTCKALQPAAAHLAHSFTHSLTHSCVTHCARTHARTACSSIHVLCVCCSWVGTGVCMYVCTCMYCTVRTHVPPCCVWTYIQLLQQLVIGTTTIIIIVIIIMRQQQHVCWLHCCCCCCCWLMIPFHCTIRPSVRVRSNDCRVFGCVM